MKRRKIQEINNKKLSFVLQCHCFAWYNTSKCPVLNPLSALVVIWHHIIVSFQVFGTERVHWNLDILGEMHQ